MTDVSALLALAAANNDLFSAAQARAHGVTRHWISRRPGNRISVVPTEIYWTHTGSPPRGVLLDAVVLHAGADAALSHWTAGEIWGLRNVQRGEVHVTTPAHRDLTDIAGLLVAHRSADLSCCVRRTRGGRQVTSLERTVVDLATCLASRRDVRALVADVVQRALTTPARLVTQMARRPTLAKLDPAG